MRKGNIEISFEEEKIEALKFFLAEKDTSLDEELQNLIKELYEKSVPAQVRSYIEKRPVTAVKRGRKKKEPEAEEVSDGDITN